MDHIDQYNLINEFAIVGEFGFNRFEGPWGVEKDGTNWTIIRSYDDITQSLDHSDEGECAVLVADGEVVGGGVVDTLFNPEDEGEEHIIVDQYAMGGK